MKRFFVIVISILAIVSCDKWDSFLYRVVTFGNPQADGSLLGDDGKTYVFPSTKVDWQNAARVIAVLDVSKEVGENTREASMVQFSVPLLKDPVVISSGEIPDSLGFSPINVSDIWYSGGYINMINAIKVQSVVKVSHAINLALDVREQVRDTLFLLLRHREEPKSPETIPANEYTFYSSFPISEYMPKRDSIVLKVSWLWDGKEGSVAGKVGI